MPAWKAGIRKRACNFWFVERLVVDHTRLTARFSSTLNAQSVGEFDRENRHAPTSPASSLYIKDASRSQAARTTSDAAGKRSPLARRSGLWKPEKKECARSVKF